MEKTKGMHGHIVEIMGEDKTPHLTAYAYVNGELVATTAAGLSAELEAAAVEALRDAMNKVEH